MLPDDKDQRSFAPNDGIPLEDSWGTKFVFDHRINNELCDQCLIGFIHDKRKCSNTDCIKGGPSYELFAILHDYKKDQDQMEIVCSTYTLNRTIIFSENGYLWAWAIPE